MPLTEREISFYNSEIGECMDHLGISHIVRAGAFTVQPGAIIYLHNWGHALAKLGQAKPAVLVLNEFINRAASSALLKRLIPYDKELVNDLIRENPAIADKLKRYTFEDYLESLT